MLRIGPGRLSVATAAAATPPVARIDTAAIRYAVAWLATRRRSAMKPRGRARERVGPCAPGRPAKVVCKRPSVTSSGVAGGADIAERNIASSSSSV